MDRMEAKRIARISAEHEGVVPGWVVVELLAELDQQEAEVQQLKDTSPYIPCQCGRKIHIPSAEQYAVVQTAERDAVAAEVERLRARDEKARAVVRWWADHPAYLTITAGGRAALDDLAHAHEDG